MIEDAALRARIYDEIVQTGRVLSVAGLSRKVGEPQAEVQAALRRMHDAHMLVLQPSGELLMANPF